MKIKKYLILLPLLAGLGACDDFSFLAVEQENGELRWSLDKRFLTKSTAEIPDTNRFLLSIRDAQGEILYEGEYGDSPEYLPVRPGYYTVSVVSIPFSAPAFSRPQYGDEKVVAVASGESVCVKLLCSLCNAGIRLRADESFLHAHPGGVLYIEQGETRLRYESNETRIAYVFPQETSVLLYRDSREETLYTRRLEARQILTVHLSTTENGEQNSISVAVDTTRNWTDDELNTGESGGKHSGESWEDAFPVSEAAAHTGEKGRWICGYIVGGDLTASGKNVKTSGIGKNTHFALADRSSITTKESCVAVELPKGDLRDQLNLADHPELIGTRIYLKGNVTESYYGTVGLKGTSEYRFP